MGFDHIFVRQFLHKHTAISTYKNKNHKGVYGIHEADFLWGLAAVLGVDTSKFDRKQRRHIAIRTIAEACIAALNEAEDRSEELMSLRNHKIDKE